MYTVRELRGKDAGRKEGINFKSSQYKLLWDLNFFKERV